MVVYGCAPSSWILCARKCASRGSSGAYVKQPLAVPAVEAVVHPTGFQCFEAEHPVVPSRLQLASVLGLCAFVVVSDLFDQREFHVAVEVVSGEPEMVVEGSSFWVLYVASVSVKS